MTNLLSLLRTALAAALLAGMGAAQAFLLPTFSPVVEHYDAATGHYGLVVEPGAVPTGYVFYGQVGLPTPMGCVSSCQAVVRSFKARDSGSVLWTGDAAEIAILEQPSSGWVPQTAMFLIHLPGADGTCASNLTPVYRLYNGRGHLGDSNHRFAWSNDVRSRMTARGWIDEGVKFCAYFAIDQQLEDRVIGFALPKLAAGCGTESCIAAVSMPAPTITSGDPHGAYKPVFFGHTGMQSTYAYGIAPGSAEAVSQRSFMQITADHNSTYQYGISLQSSDRTGGTVSSFSPRINFNPGPSLFRGTHTLFAPFKGYDTDSELRIAFTAFVRSVSSQAGGHAYVLPVLELTDATSQQKIQLSIQAMGTVPPGDFLGRDDTGKVIVSTTFRAAPPFGRSLGLEFLRIPQPFVSVNAWGWGGLFDFRISRDEFAQVLAFARLQNPTLSPAPEHYLVNSYELRVESAGTAHIGMNASDIRLQVLRR